MIEEHFRYLSDVLDQSCGYDCVHYRRGGGTRASQQGLAVHCGKWFSLVFVVSAASDSDYLLPVWPDFMPACLPSDYPPSPHHQLTDIYDDFPPPSSWAPFCPSPLPLRPQRQLRSTSSPDPTCRRQIY